MMKRETACLLVLGLVNFLSAAELALDDIPQSDLKEIEAEIAKGNIPPDYVPADKTKRGVSKLSVDSSSYNNLQSSAGSSVKSSANANQVPYRYVYNNQNQQSGPYASYLQSSHGSHFGSQYPFQASGVTHYLQTPTQIQFVTTSPQGLKYQKEASQFQVPPAQQLYLQSPQTLYQAQATAGSTQTSSSGSHAQYQVPQHLYYQQQPIVMLLIQQPQAGAVLYPNQQQQQPAYILGHQPFLNVFGGHRFSLPYAAAPQNNQVTYLIPMTVQTAAQQAVVAPSGIKPGDKAALNAQTSPSHSSYGLRATKA